MPNGNGIVWQVSFPNIRNSAVWRVKRELSRELSEYTAGLAGYFRTSFVSFDVQRTLFWSQIMKTLHFLDEFPAHTKKYITCLTSIWAQTMAIFLPSGEAISSLWKKERLPRRGKTKGGFEEEEEEEEKGDGIYNFPDPRPLFASAFQFEW